MATLVWKDAKVFLGAYNLQTYTTQTALDFGSEALDETCLGDDTRINKGGLKTVGGGVTGLWDSTPDAGLFDYVGTADNAFSVIPSGTVGDVAYFLKTLQTNYNLTGTVGELFGFDMQVTSTNPLIRGTLMHHATDTTTGTGTAYQLGAVGATETLWGALHVFSVSASDTLDVIVQSDNAEGMSSPVTQLTFTQATDATYEFQSAAGAITDDWFRVSYTIGGADVSIAWALVLGIH